MTIFAAREGYRLWAPTYANENAITCLEDKLVSIMSPSPCGLRLLDAGCGTGRRLKDSGAASAVGVDLCPEMLDAGATNAAGEAGVRMIVGDVRDLPLPDRAFDVVWCRLVIGHLPDCRTAYAELARVADDGAWVIVTDFHPQAYAAGHRRTFRHGGTVHEVIHHVHDIPAQIEAARQSGLKSMEVREAAIGRQVHRFYTQAGRGDLYDRHCGLPVVAAMAFRREG